MDLADKRTSPFKVFSAFLLIVNVFAREAYTRPIKNKEPRNVRAQGVKPIFENGLRGIGSR